MRSLDQGLTNYEVDTGGTCADTEIVYDADGTRVAVIDDNGDAVRADPLDLNRYTCVKRQATGHNDPTAHARREPTIADESTLR